MNAALRVGRVVLPWRLVLLCLICGIGFDASGQRPNDGWVAEIGVGMVKPNVAAGAVLYFYGRPDEGTFVPTSAPVDSITFMAGPHYVDIATAPPWLVPEVLKLDYGFLMFRARSLTRHWVEVIVNNTNGQTAWLPRSEVEFVTWVDFFLTVFAVEPIDPEANPLRPRPFLHSDPDEPHAATDGHYAPIEIRGDWIHVRLRSQAQPERDGWFRWRDGDRLTVSYSLLS